MDAPNVGRHHDTGLIRMIKEAGVIFDELGLLIDTPLRVIGRQNIQAPVASDGQSADITNDSPAPLLLECARAERGIKEFGSLWR